MEVLGRFSADFSQSTPLLDKEYSIWSVEIRHPILRNLRRLTRVPTNEVIYKEEVRLCNPAVCLCAGVSAVLI